MKKSERSQVENRDYQLINNVRTYAFKEGKRLCLSPQEVAVTLIILGHACEFALALEKKTE